MSIIIIGAGGHGKVVLDILKAEGKEIKGFIDDEKKGTFCGYDILGTMKDLERLKKEGMSQFIISIGNNDVRALFYEKVCSIGLQPVTAMHPSAIISPDTTIGKGTVIMAGVVVNPGSTIGENVILNTSCSVDHDNTISDHVQLTPGVITGGTVTVGARTYVGIGATISNDITIGADTIIGGGAMVLKDIPSHVVAVGIPAKVIKERKK